MNSAAVSITARSVRKATVMVVRSAVCLLLAGLFSFQLPLPAAAQQTGTMRCRDGIVSIEDIMAIVLKKCGPPAFEARRENTHASGSRGSRTYEAVTVDTWTYNFGRMEFMYEVTFHNGRVARIESLDQGY
jgi:hypothetical protein